MHSRLNLLAGVKSGNARSNHLGDLSNREIGFRAEQPITFAIEPFAFFVELANHTRTNILAPVVELFFQLVLDHLALFFHHQNFIQTLGKFTNPIGLQRPRHGHFVEPQANVLGTLFINTQFIQRF